MEVSPPLPILILLSPPIIFGLHVGYAPSSSCPSLLHAAAFPNSLLHRSLELPHFSVTSLLPKCSNLYALILALTPFCTLRRLQAVSMMPMHCLPLLISCMLVVILFFIKLRLIKLKSVAEDISISYKIKRNTVDCWIVKI